MLAYSNAKSGGISTGGIFTLLGLGASAILPPVLGEWKAGEPPRRVCIGQLGLAVSTPVIQSEITPMTYRLPGR
jgi:hypothetical protein